jgi:hypothetical protein
VHAAFQYTLCQVDTQMVTRQMYGCQWCAVTDHHPHLAQLRILVYAAAGINYPTEASGYNPDALQVAVTQAT